MGEESLGLGVHVSEGGVIATVVLTIPDWLINAGMWLGGGVLVLLAGIGVVFLIYMRDFQVWR